MGVRVPRMTPLSNGDGECCDQNPVMVCHCASSNRRTVERSCVAPVPTFLSRVFVIILTICTTVHSINPNLPEESPPPTAESKNLANESLSMRGKPVEDPLAFDDRGMEYIYSATSQFLTLILPGPQTLPQEVVDHMNFREIELSDAVSWLNDYTKTHYEPILRFYLNPVVMVIVGVVLTIVFTFSGILYFFCRCCCRTCGKRTQHDADVPEKRGDACRRLLLNFLLTAVTIIMAFGSVVALMNTAYTKKGLYQLPPQTMALLDEIEGDSNTMIQRFRQRFQNESTAIPNEIMGFVEGTGHEFRTAFVEVVEGKAIEELAEITRRIPVIRGHLEAINLKSIEFIHTKEIMNAGLDEIRNKLKVILGQCELEACQKFLRENDLNQLRVVDLENLPDLSNIVDGIEFALSRGILSDGQMAFDALNGIEERVERQVESLRPRLRQKVEQLKQQLEEFSSHLSYIGADLKQAKQVVKMVQQGLDEYGDYGFYVFYAISILILLIVLILLCALLCALCGTPQSRRTGSSLLVIDIYLMLFSPLVILPVVIVLFVGSVPTDRIVCSSLPDFPNTSFTQIVSTIEFTINTREGPIKTDLIRFVRSCHNNASMLDALSLPPGLSPERLEKLPEEVGLRQELEKYTGRISLPGTMRFVPKNAIEDVLALNRSGLFTLNLGPFSRLANQSLVAGDLEALESALNETALEVGKTSPRSTLKYRLFNYAKGIKGQREFLASAEAIAQDISRRANEVDQLSFSFEGDPIAVAIEKRLREVERIREQLTSNNRELSGKVASQFTDTILQNISAHLKSVALELRGGQTRCGSISLAINRTTDVLCKNLLLPYNAVWSGLGFTVLFFIVAVLIALPLSILYSRIKMDPREQSIPLHSPRHHVFAPDSPLDRHSDVLRDSVVYHEHLSAGADVLSPVIERECFYDAYSESNHHYLPLGKVHHQPSAPPAATYSAADYSPGAYLPRVTAHPTAAPSAPTNTRLLQASDTFGAESNSSAARLIDHETPPVYPGEPALEPQEYERPPPYYFPGPKEP